MTYCDDDMCDMRGGREEKEEEWRCPTKNKNPTLRMWGISIPAPQISEKSPLANFRTVL